MTPPPPPPSLSPTASTTASTGAATKIIRVTTAATTAAATHNNSAATSTSMSRTTIDSTVLRSFCRLQKGWLELEQQAAEQEEEGEAKGGRNQSQSQQSLTVRRAAVPHSSSAPTLTPAATTTVLRNLQVSRVSVGLYGRTVLHVESVHGASPTLPAHRYTTGDEVQLVRGGAGAGGGAGASSNKTTLEGVVCEVSDNSLAIALFGGGGNGARNKGNSNNHPTKNDAPQTDSDYLDFQIDEWPPPLTLRPRHSRDVHNKLVKALDRLEQHGLDDSHVNIVKALFEPNNGEEEKPPCLTPATTASAPLTKARRDDDDNVPFDNTLNDSQLQAIHAALNNDSTTAHSPVTLVHGPPGTGKTTTLVELVRQAVLRKQWKVLVAAPSNVAVDTVLSKLAIPIPTKPVSKRPTGLASRRGTATTKSLRMVRLGHPARLNPAILPYSLEALVQSADGTQIVADVRKELQSLWTSKASSAFPSREDRRRHLRSEATRLRREIRDRESKVVKELLSNAHVVLATCVGAANKLLDTMGGGSNSNDKDNAPYFDLVVIDEAAQSLEAACWIPALRCKSKLVLAGDHKQLPPTIKAHDLLQQLGRTMFERVHELRPCDAKLLTVQYRMHQAISDWASQAMYDGRLQAHESVRGHTLADLSSSAIHDGTSTPTHLRNSELAPGGLGPLVWIDTAGCDLHESVATSGSKSNAGEAALVVAHVARLLQIGIVAPHQLAVITPYRGQVDLIRAALAGATPPLPALDVRSVDGFQGGEREAIILSLVRSHPPHHRSGSDGSIGFLRDDRRLNVAITRSRRHCCIIGDSDTVRQSPFIRTLLEWVDDHGERLSAWNYGSEEFDSGGAVPAPRLRGMRRKPPPLPEPETPESLARQQALVEQIRCFAATAAPGETMRLPTDLSRHDRRRVHEEAESLNLLHTSEGTEGVDRRLTVAKPVATVAPLKPAPISTTAARLQDESSSTPTASAEQSSLAARTSATTAVPIVHDITTARANNEDDLSEAPLMGTAVSRGDNLGSDTEEPNVVQPSTPSFQALIADDSSDESEGPDEAASSGSGVADPSSNGALPLVAPTPDMNSHLAELARERAQRAQKVTQSAAPKEAPGTASLRQNPTKTLPKQGRKLGGAKNKKPDTPNPVAVDDSDALDDMAFLDAQIYQNQTAHGRKLEGKGGYRTVLNGILTATPASASLSKKRDPKAMAALQSKVKQAATDRKAKPPSKKR